MIQNLTRQNLNKIVSDAFREDAERHVYAYESFMEYIRKYGIETDEKTTSFVFTPIGRFENVSGINRDNSGHSLSYGYLSPACTHCRTGEQSKTVFHTLKCNQNCYFCANMNQANYDYYVDNINNAFEEITDSDKGGGFLSIALTGGEPLLLPDKTLEFFIECRKRYPEVHLRLYTNGDFLYDELAKELAAVGLDEIRISVKVTESGYSEETIQKVALASQYFPAAIVEMPVIPGTLAVMKKLFLELDKAGCKGINILEFLYPWINNEQFRNRGFKIKEHPYKVLYDYSYAGGLPISGSSEECIELLIFAAEKKLKMGVHYCSLENKLTSQIYHQNAGVRLMPHEFFSEKDFFIKTVRVYGRNATRASKYFSKNNYHDYVTQSGGLELEFHPKHLQSIEELTEAALTYNIVKEIRGIKTMVEIKIDLIDPAYFDYEADI